jgi:hypothetical protein
VTPFDPAVVRATGDLALQVAALATEAIGPEGTVMKVPDKAEADLIRTTFIGKLAEAAIRIANEEG